MVIYIFQHLHSVLIGLLASFGEAPGVHAHHHHELGGTDNPDNLRGPSLNPLLSIFSQFMPGIGSGQAGDFVYSQEALDRIVTQLMEQTSTSSAPGPASQSDIDSLPRKEVTVEMLGNEGRAECSICMDEVNIGEQVTELPCHHWFHHACVAAWLAEHDTCPHCRKGISKNSPENSQADSGAGGADPTRQMPGSFAGGEGNYTDSFGAHDPSSTSQTNPTGQGDLGAGPADESGGISERIRRGLFGPPR
jgi:E3 ubiquitin-protein ligase RNF115/126